MTMIGVDNVTVVFEGAARLRWRRQSRCVTSTTESVGSPPTPCPLTAPWPDPAALAVIERRLRLLAPTLVVFDGDDERRVLSRRSLPTIPEHVIADPAGAGSWTVGVEPLSWLRGHRRVRGLAFRARSARLERDSRSDEAAIFIEPDLVGTLEPLRFVYHRGALDFQSLRQVIDAVFRKPDMAPSPRHTRIGFDT